MGKTETWGPDAQLIRTPRALRAARTYAPGPPYCTYGDAHQPRACCTHPPSLCRAHQPSECCTYPRHRAACPEVLTHCACPPRACRTCSEPWRRPRLLTADLPTPASAPTPAPAPCPTPKPYPLPYPEPRQPRRATPGSSSTPTPTPTPGSKDSENHSAMLRCARLTAPTPTPESTPTPTPESTPNPCP